MNIKEILAIIGVFMGGYLSNIYMELLITSDPGCGNLVNFLRFAFITVNGFIFISKFGTANRHIPLKNYIFLVVLFFLDSLAKSYAFAFNIPMPMHMVFRAGSLMTNMVMGIIILKKKYTLVKYVSASMITIGIIIFAAQSGAEVKNSSSGENDASQQLDAIRWGIGVTILICSLFLTARIGIYQETLFQQHGKYPWEALYYSHALPMPFFLALSTNMWEHWVLSGESAPLDVFFGMPSSRLFILCCILTQVLCTGSVYVLVTESSSLTMTLTVTLKKFVSLLFSIFYFEHSLTCAHWIGTFFVFLGTLIFTELLQEIIKLFTPQPVNSSVKYSQLTSDEQQDAEV